MWDCWGSDVRRVAAALLAVAALAAAAPAGARDRIVVHSRDGRVVERVRIGPEGVTITTRGGRDSIIDADSLGVGPIVVDDSNSKVRLMSDVTVKPGERVDGDAVAIFGNVRVSGTLTGSAVAVFGSVTIDPGASVGEDAVAVMGTQHSSGGVGGSEVAVLGSVDLRRGATVGQDAVAVGGRVVEADSTHIGGQSVSVSMLPLSLGLPGLGVALGIVFLGWLITVFFGWLAGTLFPDRLARVAVTSSRHTFLSIVLSLLSVFVWPTVAVLAAATIVGLPLGILMLLVWPVLVYAGQVSATYVLGCKLMRRRLGEGPVLGPVAAGSGFIAALFALAVICYHAGGLAGAFSLFFGLVAMLLVVGLTIIGTGAVLLSRFGGRERGAGPAGHAPGVTPVPGAATT
jgi:hypothetical protein